MTSLRPGLVIALLIVLVAVAVGWVVPGERTRTPRHATVAGPRLASGPLQTAVVDPFLFGSANRDVAFDRTRAAGATAVVLAVGWRYIAPEGTVKPAAFDASNPADPLYRWTALDAQVRSAVAHGLEPIATVHAPPDWAASQGPNSRDWKPSPDELKLFAIALATRYSGTFQDLPRIRSWSVWNEPNLIFYLEPQIVDGAPFSPGWYRDMVNEFAAGVHGVDPSNLVVAGNLAPFTSRTGNAGELWGVAPLVFMRSLMCLSQTLQPTCSNAVHFDVWAHHPYTSGGPRHHATLPDDVSLGDLPEMHKVLLAGIRSGNVVSTHNIGFWVTEFSWDSNPPDTGGLKLGLGARWAAEALYQMWRSGVTLATWFLLTDQPTGVYFAQSGLYLRGSPSPQADQAKPLLTAFRFPFVAYKLGAPARSNRAVAYSGVGIRVKIWGRVPSGSRSRVAVEQLRNGLWRPVSVVTTNQYGIFGRRLYVPSKGRIRARSLTEKAVSRSFSLAAPRDRFVRPFGDDDGGG